MPCRTGEFPGDIPLTPQPCRVIPSPPPPSRASPSRFRALPPIPRDFPLSLPRRSTQIKTYSWDNAQVLLVGNKCDMEDERVVSSEKGRQLAEHLGELAAPFPAPSSHK